HIPPPETSYAPQVLVHLMDKLLENGHGAVINPVGHDADWVLSYGDILNFCLSGAFYHSGDSAFSKNQNSETLSEKDKVSVSSPSEDLLPKKVRKHLRKLLIESGIQHPKILLMHRERPKKEPREDLIFNFTPQDFKHQKQYEKTLNAIRWYLPQHYSWATVDEDSLPPVFASL